MAGVYFNFEILFQLSNVEYNLKFYIYLINVTPYELISLSPISLLIKWSSLIGTFLGAKLKSYQLHIFSLTDKFWSHRKVIRPVCCTLNWWYCFVRLWDEVQKASNDRGNSLDNTLEVARRFWQQLNAVMAQLSELEDTLSAQPPPAAQPRDIQAQQLALQEIRHEIDHTKPEVRIFIITSAESRLRFDIGLPQVSPRPPVLCYPHSTAP